MDSYEVTTYNVGQGLFNLLRVIDDDGDWVFCGIFDCGTISNPSQNNAQIIDHAVNQILEADGLNCVVISHQDEDHWSYLLEIIRGLVGDLDKNTWYTTDWIDRYVKINNTSNSLIVERCWEKEFFESEYLEYVYTCTGTYLSYSVALKEITNNEDNEVTVSIKAGVGNTTSKFKLLGVKIDNKYRFDSVTLTRINASTRVRGGIGAVRNAIRDYIRDYWYFFAASSPGVISGLTSAIIYALTLSETYSTEGFVSLGDAHIPHIYLGGGLAGIQYQALAEYMSLFGYVNRLTSKLMCLSYESFQDPVDITIDEEVSDCSGQSYSDSIARNATSLITCFSTPSIQGLLFPGDATIHTFGGLRDKLLSDIPHLEFIAAPHHGSYHTNIVLNAEGEQADAQPVIDFFDTFSPETVAVSAYHSKFGHPAYDVIDFMAGYAKDCAQHPVLVCTSDEQVLTGLSDPVYDYPTHIALINKSLYTTETINGAIVTVNGNVAETQTHERKTFKHLPMDDMFICRKGVKL